VVFNSGVVDNYEIFVLTQLKAWAWAMFRYKTISCSFPD